MDSNIHIVRIIYDNYDKYQAKITFSAITKQNPIQYHFGSHLSISSRRLLILPPSRLSDSYKSVIVSECW